MDDNASINSFELDNFLSNANNPLPSPLSPSLPRGKTQSGDGGDRKRGGSSGEDFLSWMIGR